MYWHGSLDNTRRTVEKIIADRAKGILVITGIGSTPCPLEGLKLTLDSITLNEMSFGPEEELFIDAKGVSMPSRGQAWGTKAFLVDGAQVQPTGDEALIRRVEAVPMKVMFEPKEGTDQPIDGIDVLSHAEIDNVVNYMRMGMHDRVAAKKRRAMVASPHWWDDKMLVTGKYEKDEFVARVMDHIADQYDGPVGSDPPTWGFPRVGTGSDEHQPEAANFRRLSVGIATHNDEDGISDEEKSDSDPEEAYTAVRSVGSIPKQAAEEAQENPKVAELKERLIHAYPRLFSGVANKNPPDRGRFGTAKIKLKPNPKIYRHREYQLQGDRAEAMKKLLAEFIERGWIEPSDSEWASPAFIVPKKEKGEWRLVVDYRGLNEQTEHDSYSLPLMDSILQKQRKKRIFTVLDLKHGYHQMPLHPDSRPCTAMSTPLGPMQWKVVPMGAKNGNAAFQRMMEDLLGPVRDCADPFVDDIIIGSGTENMTEDELIEAHEKDLRRVLSELDKHNMVCKPTKASLFVKEVEFAGHVVGHGQRRPMPGKLASLHHWEKPQTISELRSFMGFCNYYSGYVRMYAELSGPLHKMLQVGQYDGWKGSKKKLAWTPEAEDAFNSLKERLLGQLGLFLVDTDKDSCYGRTPRTMPWGQSSSKSGTTGLMFPWRFRAGSWRRANAEHGPRGRRRHTPLYVRSGSGLATLDCSRWWFARTTSPYRAGTRSMSTPPQDQRLEGPDGTRRSPSSTSASCTSRGRTTLWQIASVAGPTPRARRGWTYPAMAMPRRPRRPSASSRWKRPWSKRGSSVLW